MLGALLEEFRRDHEVRVLALRASEPLPYATTITVTVGARPAPIESASVRNGASETPAIGARMIGRSIR